MQNDRHYHVARVVVGEGNTDVRQATKSTLFNHGFRHIIDTSTVNDIRGCLGANMIDLIVCDADMDGCGFCQTVHEMRDHHAGDNPFVVVLAMTGNPTRNCIQRLIDCGADDILMKPLQPGALFRRIEQLVMRRKPFVVTYDYIGPDRRGGTRDDDPAPLPLIEVPNPLQAKVVGNVSAAALRQSIRDSWMTVNEHRMERHSVQIQWLLKRMGPAFHDHAVTAETAADLDRLLFVAQDLSLRLDGTRFDHVGRLAVTLVDVIRRIRRTAQAPDPRAVGLLPRLADAISAAFSRDHGVMDASREITEEVSRYTEAS